MAIALYARVSSTSPTREESIDSQLAALYDYAQQKGYSYEPADVCTDRGYSGQRLERPGLDALRDHWYVQDLNIAHIYIKKRTARLNGKVERSHRIDEEEILCCSSSGLSRKMRIKPPG